MSSPAQSGHRCHARQDRLQPVPDVALREHPAVDRCRPQPGRRRELPRRHQGQPPEPEHGARPADPADQALPAGRAGHGGLAVPRRRARCRGTRAGDHRRLERDHATRPGRTSSSLRTSPALASSDSSTAADQGSRSVDGQAPETREPRRATTSLGAWRSDGAARWLFIWPTVLVILVPVALPAGRLARPVALEARLPPGRRRPQVRRLRRTTSSCCSALERSHFLGVLKPPTPVGWAISSRRSRSPRRLDARSVRSGRSARSGSSSACSAASCWSASSGCSSRPWPARAVGPASLIVTLIFVFVGIALQYLLGLGLALLAVQQVPWPPLLPGRLPDPADDHAGRRRATCS